MPFASVRKVALAVLACSLIAGAATCKAPPSTHTVPIDGLAFQPPELTVRVGDSIVWINKDPFPHNVKSAAGEFQSGDVAPDGEWKFQATKAGRFPYECTLHPGMDMRVRVS